MRYTSHALKLTTSMVAGTVCLTRAGQKDPGVKIPDRNAVLCQLILSGSTGPRGYLQSGRSTLGVPCNHLKFERINVATTLREVVMVEIRMQVPSRRQPEDETQAQHLH